MHSPPHGSATPLHLIADMLQSAIALHQAGQLDAAEVLYQNILAIQDRHFDALLLLGTIAAQRGQPGLAVDFLVQAKRVNPNHPGLLNNLGYAFRELNRVEDALSCYDRAVDLQPDLADAHNNRGLVLADMNRHELALQSYDRAISLTPHNAKAHCNRGAVLRSLGRLEAALASYDLAIAIAPGYAEAHCKRANLLTEQLRNQEALLSYERAISIRPDYIEALNNQGLTLLELKRYSDAFFCFEQALGFAPNHAEILCNRGNAMAEMDHMEEALASFDQAIRLKPDLAKAHVNRGNLLSQLRQVNEALNCYDRALAIAPDLTDAINNQAVALYESNRLDESLKRFDKLLAINPEHLKALINRGNVLRDLHRLKEAKDSFERALQVNPDHDFLYGTWLHTKMKICDWTDLDAQILLLEAKIQQGQKASPPFPVLSLTESLQLTRKSAETWVRAKYPANRTLPPLPKLPRHKRIRIGYFSADFHNHATSYLIAEMLEKHDKTQFELYGFSFGPKVSDPMVLRVTSALDHFLEVQTHSDKYVALLARQHEIDIAIDLKGFTQDSRPQIFALRAAPIQVNYLGYPGTMAAGYMDYLIADPTLVPESEQAFYSEKIVYLPHTYQANDTQRPIAERTFTRTEMGLPESSFVFCCFNNNYKITPRIFQCWMRILTQVEGSILWLFEDNSAVADNLRAAATSHKVDASRVVFAKRMSLADHLSRHKLADLFLDTLPYCAHTTASDALWSGLPLLTCAGATFAGRVAASLLTAINLPELITTDLETYEHRALELARHPEKLADFKARLIANRSTAPLFNSQLFTRNLEAAYLMMYEHYHSDSSMPAGHIHPKVC